MLVGLDSFDFDVSLLPFDNALTEEAVKELWSCIVCGVIVWMLLFHSVLSYFLILSRLIGIISEPA